ncbi:Lrp/AsnC family transcriptional regulator [Halohasta litorea]|uniref:Lrp/AsnC family transcriptional regulator n=1 Tax=Halohasta litorea TaxID=869891 RepID=A0ABD6D3L1_9EURY|nr:winged helix-turn-helix transcriptional regulator [Halohasta litorea]
MGPILDAVDRQILYTLQEDSRTPITAIADELNVSDNTVRNRLSKLEERGVIEGYSIQINYDHAGIPHYYLFVCTAGIQQRERLATKATDIPGVLEVMTVMTGMGNVHIRAAAMGKNEITNIAEQLDSMGLRVEKEHLIWTHRSQPCTVFNRESAETNPRL